MRARSIICCNRVTQLGMSAGKYSRTVGVQFGVAQIDISSITIICYRPFKLVFCLGYMLE